MGGKGRKRREKNYRAAHGGFTRLPPPPKPGDVDALPSKLRKIMEFNTANNPSATKRSEKASTGSEQKKKKKKKDGGVDQKLVPNNDLLSGALEVNEEVMDENVTEYDGKSIMHKNDLLKKKAKRKRKQVSDLRFESAAEELGAVGLKRRERKKKHLEARKKKQKKEKPEENLDFPACEEIKFGDVVLAPPKLAVFPKALKNVQNASHERLRLQAVEAYRNRKGWVSRPGISLPAPITTIPPR